MAERRHLARRHQGAKTGMGPGPRSAPVAGILSGFLLAACLAAPAAAQDHKTRLQSDFQRLRGNVLAMVEAMPAAALRSAPTDGVRDFAEQIEHIASGSVNIIATGVDSDDVDLGMNRDRYLDDKEALAAFVNAAFDRVDAMLAEMTPEDLESPGSLFVRLERPRWMIVQAAYEHGVWTLGATVPYLRTAGVAPPGYNLVPGWGR